MAHPPHSPNTAAHIRVSGVSASFGSHRVLTDISFSVAVGDPTGLIGGNGSDKSTLLRIMAGLRAPDAGEVLTVGPGDPLRVGLLHQVPPPLRAARHRGPGRGVGGADRAARSIRRRPHS